jgi:hypothetical protein
VDARLSSGRSRVRVPYGALCRGGCWLPIRAFNPGRAGSIPAHGARPRWSSGRTPGSQPGEGGFDSRTRCVRRGGDGGPRLPCKKTPQGSSPCRSTSRVKNMWTFAALPWLREPVRGRSSAPRSPSPTGRGTGLRNRRIGVRIPGRVLTGCRRAATPPALGAGDRGFESLHPDLPVDQRSGHLADIEEMPVQLWPGKPRVRGVVGGAAG